MAEFDTVLTGRVILTGDEQPGSFVAIRDGRIAMIGQRLALATGGAVPPGVDQHCVNGRVGIVLADQRP
ncbi:hypothetical protein [Paracoccus kondratievae]|uniref:Uncharacterized protein n=1 Tax=Paracoccus kondratievae TaxID=135740 RepID=A0AAD3NXK7_9RHOB|nr:hypothetical protein [Paracoccus kondratievae]GLK64466.1 hypothetical protein GCM10017635_19370 [Paracoccus kondratievae]